MDDGWDSDDGSGMVSTNKQFEVVNNPRGSSNWDDRSSGADYKSNRNYNNRSDGPRKQYKSDNSYQNRGGGGGGDNDSFEVRLRIKIKNIVQTLLKIIILNIFLKKIINFHYFLMIRKVLKLFNFVRNF